MVLVCSSTIFPESEATPVARIDPLGYTSTLTYDELNRQISMQDPGGGIWTTAYDANSNVIAQTDPLAQTTTTVYDPVNRSTQTIDARGGINTTVYDAVDNIVNLIDPAVVAIGEFHDCAELGDLYTALVRAPRGSSWT